MDGFQEYLRLVLKLLLGIGALGATIVHVESGGDVQAAALAVAAGWFVRAMLYPHKDGEERT